MKLTKMIKGSVGFFCLYFIALLVTSPVSGTSVRHGSAESLPDVDESDGVTINYPDESNNVYEYLNNLNYGYYLIPREQFANSTREGVKPLEIILDDSELSDLTRCLDLLRFDSRFNIKWNLEIEKPFTKSYLLSNLNKSRINFNLFYAFILFISSSLLFLIIPINKQYEFRDTDQTHLDVLEQIYYN